MVELVVRELRHEIEAYQDFCAFRAREMPGTRTTRSRARNGCQPGAGPAVADAQPAQARARAARERQQQRPLTVLGCSDLDGRATPAAAGRVG
jgi:hypothetical protein